MKNLLFLLVLGLLALVQASPLTAVTQIPDDAENDDVLREALTDGFLVGHVFTTEAPGTNATMASTASTQSQSESEGGAEDQQVTETTTTAHEDGDQVTEKTTTTAHEDGDQVTEKTTTTAHEDGDQVTETTTPHEDGDQVTETTTTTPHEDGDQVTEVTTEPEYNDQVTETTQSLMPYHTLPTSTPNDVDSWVSTSTQMSTSTLDWVVTVTTPDLSTMDFLTSDSGSGQSEDASWSSTAAQSSTSAPPSSTTSSFGLFENSDGSGSGFTDETAPEPSTTTAGPFESLAPIAPRFFINMTELETVGESPGEEDLVTPGKTEGAAAQVSGSGTPGWMIIVGFIVGVAALVLLCVAIATRDKWNGPHTASQAQSKVESSNQQGEQETELLHKQQPRENGRSEEYTVIPLEELPESYSSD